LKTPSRSEIEQLRVLVTGDVILDRYWFGDVDRISPEAPVPIVSVKRAEERLGGAANVARNMTALGARAGLLAVLGKDEAAVSVSALLREASITAHVQSDDHLPTTVKLRIVGRTQQMLRADFERLPDHETLLKHLDGYRALLDGYDIVVLSDYGKGGLTHIAEMIEAAHERGKRVLVDPKGDDYSRYKGATLITPNQAELRAVVGRWKSEQELASKAQHLRTELELEALLLTRSEEGMTLYTAEGHRSVPAQAREVFDVTGAGDTVIAVLAVMLAGGQSIWDAVQVANRAGGVVVGKFGTATVSYDELFGTSS